MKLDISSACISATLCTMILLCSPAFSRQQAEVKTESNSGKIVRATLYRDKALVTREIKIQGSEGEREILVGQLPENVLTESLFADGMGKVEVRAVRVSRKLADRLDNQQVQKLTEELQKSIGESNELRQKATSNRKQMEYIEKLMNFTAVSTSSDLARGVLNADSLTQISKFALDNQKQLAEAGFQIEVQLQQIEKRQSGIQQQIAQLTDTNKPVYEAVIAISSKADGVIELSYLVAGCSWSPSYAVHGSIDNEQFQLRSSALIQQMSGEDWSNVKLSLSTSSPSVNSAGPSLTPFRVSVSSRGSAGPTNASQGVTQKSNGMSTLIEKQSDVVRQFVSGHRDDENLGRDLALNEVANEFQNFELQADAAQLKSMAADVGAEISGQTYEIAQPVRLASRREQHNVLISDSKLPGKMYHVATPLLSSFAFREAELKNNRAEGLLAGPAWIYLDGKFIGRTELPSVASGQLFMVGFGADQQVRTRRELLSKQDEVVGGNRLYTLKYRLVVANFKSKPIKLRLIDRLPLAGQGAEVQVTYDAANPALSADGLYNRIQRPRGILRWDIQVEAERFGAKAHDVEYTYSVSFDRTLQLATNTAKPQIQQDMYESAPSATSGGMGGMGGGMGGMGGAGSFGGTGGHSGSKSGGR